MGKAKKDEIEKILVRGPNWIGDGVMSLPAIDLIGELFPASEVTVLAKGWTLPLYENNPNINNLIEFPGGSLIERLDLRGDLQRGGYDMAILFQNSFEIALLCNLSHIPEIIGYGKNFRGPLLTKSLKDEVGRGAHHSEYYLRLVDVAAGGDLGGEVRGRSKLPKISITDSETKWAVDFLNDKSLRGSVEAAPDGSLNLVGITPGASFGPAKRWPVEYFAETLTELYRDRGLFPIIFGSSNIHDLEAARGVERALDIPSLNLTGDLSLREFMSVLTRLKVFISNDSGPMHVASALGVPTVGIFGSTDPNWTGPSGSRVKVLYEKMECSPCFERECRSGHYDCLTTVKAGDVAQAAVELIGSSPAGTGGEKRL